MEKLGYGDLGFLESCDFAFGGLKRRGEGRATKDP